MANQFGRVEKIYSLKILGYDDLSKQLDNVSKKFDNIKKAKQSAEGKLLGTSDVAEIKKFSDEIAKLKIQEQQLRIERQKMLNESKAANLARQEEIRLQKEKLKGNTAEAGSIVAIRQQIKELNALLITKNQKGTSTINFQGEILSIDQATQKLKQLITTEQDFRRVFARDQLLVAEYASGIKQGLGGIGDIGKKITTSVSNGFKQMTGQIGLFVISIFSAQAAFSKLNQAVDATKEVSDTISELEVNMGLARGGVDGLVESLKKINTRTTLQGLLNIADLALKAGVSNENLLGVTEAIDKVKIAFGKDFGSIEQGTETMAKLISIFFKDGQITADRILTIGNAIRTLANETTASVPFLTDFAGRMAGVKQIANVSLADIIGLGAGFEQFKQSAETSSTALVKVIPQLAKDTEKFAKIAGITKEEFGALLENNPAEALIKVAESLVKSGKGIEDISAALADSELGSGRITTILATLGGKADVFRERIARAGESIQETGAITEAFDRKNENLAATFDKINKRFLDLAGNKKFQAFIENISAAILGLIGLITNIPFPLLIAGMTVAIGLTNTWLGSMLRLITAFALEKAALIVETAQLAISNAVRATATTLLNIYTVATIRSATATGAAAVAYRLLAGAITFLTSPLGIAVGLVVGLTTVIGALSARAGSTSTSIKDLTKSQAQLEAQQRINMSLAEKIAASSGDQIARIKQLTTLVKDQSASESTRKKALDELIKISPKYRQALQGEKLDIEALTKVSDDLITSLQKQARARAVSELTGEKEKRVFELESKIAALPETKFEDETGAGAFLKNLGSRIGLGKGTVGQQRRDLQNELTKEKEDLNAIYNLVRGNKDIQQAIIDQRSGTTTGTGPKTTTSVSKLSNEQKNIFKDIEARRNELLVKNEKARLEEKIDEEKFLNNIYQINLSAIRKKINLLRDSNVEEKRLKSELQLDEIKLLKETNDKVFDLKSKALKDQFDREVAALNERKALIQKDPTLSETEKVQARIDIDSAILQLQVNFNNAMDQLEKDLTQKSVINARERADAIGKIEANLKNESKEILFSRIDDIEETGKKEIAAQKIKFGLERKAILENDKLSATQKQRQLEALDQAENRTILSIELDTLLKQLEIKKILLQLSLLSDKEYLEAYQQAVDKATAISKTINDEDTATKEKLKKRFTSLKSFIQDSLRGLFKFDEGSDEAALLGETISQSFDLAKQAMNNFFDAERDRINENLQLQLQRLDLEKQQVINRAQSQAEIDGIEKEFAAKRRQEEKKAFEQTKKVKKSEAKLALSAELANLAVAAASAGASTGPAAPIVIPILYGVMSLLALGRYALRIGEINRESFAFGGKPGEVPIKGGKFGGKPHSKGGTNFEHKGKTYNAEVDELAVIRTKDAPKNKKYKVEGTQMEIASAINRLGGGIDFRPGAKISKFATGGMIGGILQPPVLAPAAIIQTDSVSAEKLDKLIDIVSQNSDAIKEHAEETSKRIDRIQTFVSEKDISNAQKKQAKQSAIGTL